VHPMIVIALRSMPHVAPRLTYCHSLHIPAVVSPATQMRSSETSHVGAELSQGWSLPVPATHFPPVHWSGPAQSS
jgi:hypothetical protein